jgi:hypothetical protein
MSRISALALLCLVCCTPGPVRVEIPTAAAGARSLLMSRSTSGTSTPEVIAAIDLEGDPSGARALTIEEYDGAPIEIAALAFSKPLSELDLASGRLEITRVGRKLGEIDPASRRSFTVEVHGDEIGEWREIERLPEALAEVRVGEEPKSACSSIRVHHAPAVQPNLDVQGLALISPARAVVAGQIVGGNAFFGTIDRGNGVALTAEITIPGSIVRQLLWDRKDTLFAAIETSTNTIVLQITQETRSPGASVFPREPDELPRFVLTEEQTVIAFSKYRALEIAAGSTRAIERTDLPAGLTGLGIISRVRKVAGTADGTIHYFDGSRWRAEGLVEGGEAITHFAGTNEFIYAQSYTKIFLRDESSARWSVVPDPYTTIPKRSIVMLSTGQVLVTGAAGLLAVHDRITGDWCQANSGWVRDVWEPSAWLDQRRFVSHDGYDFEDRLSSAIFWIDLE